MTLIKNAASTGLVIAKEGSLRAGLAGATDLGRRQAETASGATGKAAEGMAKEDEEATEAAPMAAGHADEAVSEKGEVSSPGVARQAAEWAAANPGTAACIGLGVGLVAAPMAAAAPILLATGFSSGGVVGGTFNILPPPLRPQFYPSTLRPSNLTTVGGTFNQGLQLMRSGRRAGSIAAGAQAAMGGSVAAGGAFATLQSAAMGGYGVAAVAGAVQGAGAAIAGTAGAAGWMRKKEKI